MVEMTLALEMAQCWSWRSLGSVADPRVGARKVPVLLLRCASSAAEAGPALATRPVQDLVLEMDRLCSPRYWPR